MAEGRTAIIVALITAGAGLAGTIFANWDKIAVSTPQPAPPPYVDPQAQVSPRTVEEAVKLSESQQRGMAGINDKMEEVVGQIEAAGASDVSGDWFTSDNYRFAFTQQGRAYQFRQYKDGSEVGHGEGTLKGNNFTHSFTADGVGSGTCSGSLAANGLSSSGTCTNGRGRWDYTVFRR